MQIRSAEVAVPATPKLSKGGSAALHQMRAIRLPLEHHFGTRQFSVNDCRRSPLETLLYRHVPDAPSDVGLPRVVAVLEGSGDKRRILVEHVVHAERDRRV